MAVSNARTVADYLLYLSNEHGDVLTQLKLQKLIYYADAWYLANYDEALIEENFEAWVHGPVVRSLYNRFSYFRWSPITLDIEEPDGLEEETKDFIKEVFQYFGKFTAYELEQMTHAEDPWLEARGDMPSSDICTNVINKDTMTRFYRQM